MVSGERERASLLEKGPSLPDQIKIFGRRKLLYYEGKKSAAEPKASNAAMEEGVLRKSDGGEKAPVGEGVHSSDRS